MTQHNTQPQDAPRNNSVGILRRVGSDVIIRQHPISGGYVVLSQTIDNDTENIIINTYEINDLIDVLQDVKELIYLETL